MGGGHDECLNVNLFWSLTQARVVIGDWKHEYQWHRPYSALGYQAPARYAALCRHLSPQGSGNAVGRASPRSPM